MSDHEELTLDKASAAFLAMDFQADIVRPGGKLAPSDEEGLAAIQAAIDQTSRALAAARSAGLRVIHVTVGLPQGGHPGVNPHVPLFQYVRDSGAIVEGTPGFAIVPEVVPADGEAVILKRGISSFAGTDLPALLQGQGITTLILAGIVTHWVVEGTARDAADRGYRLIVLKDCCASGAPERHEAALTNMASLAEIVTANDLKAVLSG